MVVKYYTNDYLTGVSGDTKPTTVITGSTFVETDTRREFYFDGTTWIPQEFITYKEFKVVKPSATTFVIDQHGNKIQSNTDTQLAVQAQLDAMPINTVYKFIWDAEQWEMHNPIVFPTYTVQGAAKRVIMEGTGHAFTRSSAGVTRLRAASDWPTNRYFFELNNPSQLAINGHVHISKFSASLGDATEAKNVGFVKLEGGNIHPGRRGFEVDHCYLEYMWRAIHLKGMIWYGYFHDIVTYESSPTFAGDAVYLIEDGGIVDPAQNPSPKVNNFQRLYHVGGGGGDSPQYADWMRMTTSSYSVVRDISIDGKTFGHAVISLDGDLGVSKNRFENVTTLDLEYPDPNTAVANLYLGGNNVYNNRFLGMHLTPNPETVLLSGSGVKKNHIEIDTYWGAVSRVTDTTADPTNTIYLASGSDPTVADSTITHTGGTSRIIDPRRGAEKAGNSTQSGDGTTTVFNIAHGLFASPVWYSVQQTSDDAVGPWKTTVSSTNLTLTYPFPPRSGTNNLSWNWRAGVNS
jgi:hypothetical protein